MVVLVMVTLHINKNMCMAWPMYSYWEIKLSLGFIAIYSFVSLIYGPHILVFHSYSSFLSVVPKYTGTELSRLIFSFVHIM